MPRRPAVSTTPKTEGLSVARGLREKYSKKDFGYGIHAGSDKLLSDVNCWISTQAPSLDLAIGQPGIPTGRVTTIFGREGSGKSLLGYHLLAECQRMGGVAILADTENRFTKDRALNIGIDLDELLIIEGLSLEKTWEAVTDMIGDVRSADSDIPVCIVFDSVAEAVPTKRLEADIGASVPALVAKFFGNEMGKLKLSIAKHRIAFVFVNQIRSRVEFTDPRSAKYAERNKIMGTKHSMLAEWPLIFGSSLMIRVNSLSPILNGKDREHPIGVRSRFVVAKTGVSSHEGWRAELDINFLHGLDLTRSVFDCLVETGVIVKNGSWFKFKADDLYDKSFHEEDFAELYGDFKPALDLLAAAAPREWLDDQPKRETPAEIDAEFDANDRYGDDGDDD